MTRVYMYVVLLLNGTQLPIQTTTRIRTKINTQALLAGTERRAKLANTERRAKIANIERRAKARVDAQRSVAAKERVHPMVALLLPLWSRLRPATTPQRVLALLLMDILLQVLERTAQTATTSQMAKLSPVSVPQSATPSTQLPTSATALRAAPRRVVVSTTVLAVRDTGTMA